MTTKTQPQKLSISPLATRRMGFQLAQIKSFPYYSNEDAADAKPLFPQTLAPGSHSCNVSLVLLMDESESISAANWQRQLHATADALEHPEVISAIKEAGGISVMARTFDEYARTVTPWHVIESEEQAHRFANLLRNGIIQGSGRTDIAKAVATSLPYFPLSPCKLARNVIDISTDGESNSYAMDIAKEQAIDAGVTIHGIAVNGKVATAEKAHKTLKEHIVTPGGYTWIADWDNYSEIIRRKLVMEIAQAGKKPEHASLELLLPATYEQNASSAAQTVRTSSGMSR